MPGGDNGRCLAMLISLRCGHVVLAVLRPGEEGRRGATVALAPALERATTRGMVPDWEIRALIVDAMARDGLDEAKLADRAVGRALGLAEPGHVLLPFLWHRRRRCWTDTGARTALTQPSPLRSSACSTSRAGQPRRRAHLSEAVLASVAAVGWRQQGAGAVVSPSDAQ